MDLEGAIPILRIVMNETGDFLLYITTFTGLGGCAAAYREQSTARANVWIFQVLVCIPVIPEAGT